MGWKNLIKYKHEEPLREAARIKETNDYIKEVLTMLSRMTISVDKALMLIQNKIDEDRDD